MLAFSRGGRIKRRATQLASLRTQLGSDWLSASQGQAADRRRGVLHLHGRQSRPHPALRSQLLSEVHRQMVRLPDQNRFVLKEQQKTTTMTQLLNTSFPLTILLLPLLLLLFLHNLLSQERSESTLSHVSAAGDGRQGVVGAVRHPHGGGHRRLHPQPGRRRRPAAPAVAERTSPPRSELTGTRPCCVSGLH